MDQFIEKLISLNRGRRSRLFLWILTLAPFVIGMVLVFTQSSTKTPILPPGTDPTNTARRLMIIGPLIISMLLGLFLTIGVDDILKSAPTADAKGFKKVFLGKIITWALFILLFSLVGRFAKN